MKNLEKKMQKSSLILVSKRIKMCLPSLVQTLTATLVAASNSDSKSAYLYSYIILKSVTQVTGNVRENKYKYNKIKVYLVSIMK